MWQLPELHPSEVLEYLRKSRADDPSLAVEEVLEKHERLLTDWVERTLPDQGPIPPENVYREVVSGETIDSRPEFTRLLRRIEDPRIKAILCVEPQRLSRGDLEDIGRLVKLLRYSKTIVITPSYTYDLRDEHDRDSFERELKRGNEYLEYQKKIMARGRRLAAEAGWYISSVPLFGYERVTVKDGRRTCYTLKPHPDEAPIVRMIFELYAEGVSTVQIADRLDAMHVKPPKGRYWSASSIHRMLDNMHYIGKIVWQRRTQVHEVQDGEIVVKNPMNDNFLVAEGRHPAIIDQALWDAVHEMIGRHPRTRKHRTNTNPLAGLLRCARCGSAMQWRNDRLPAAIRCHNRHCDCGAVRYETVRTEIVKVLRSCVADFEVTIGGGVDNSVELHRQTVARLEKRLRELQELEIAQWDEKTKGGMPAHVFERLNGATVAEIAEVQQALCDARDSVPDPADLSERVVTFRTALEALEDPDAPPQYVNRLLKQCIDRIEFDRDPQPKVGRPPKDDDRPITLDFKLRI